ncbi:undecaprenyl-phosphate glucose phosphotransferase [Schinkia azotoformans]|uniref:undecaprenyl-phosphate glucose phosphotransferase n=1 Tax=Schinkia azotoformans TaxID=1454 RepID=UPI002E205AD5|nr:undecaprenyl-phosphate glucose phosphotransferase [Schinkia azotoformans]MED4352039.1 undecaprenyl-phosphate glucose phosphotransferase [Schinkia azotoformans]
MIRGNEKFIIKIFNCCDFIVIQIAFLCTWWLKFMAFNVGDRGHISFEIYLFWSIVYGIFSVFVSYFMTLYSSQSRRLSFLKEFSTIFKVHFVSIVCLQSFLFVFRVIDFSRSFLFLYFINIILVVTLYRFLLKLALKYFRARGYNKRFILIIGAGELAIKYYHQVRNHPQIGLEVIGFLDDFKQEHEKDHRGMTEIIGKINDLSLILEERIVDEVVVALPLHAYEKYEYIVQICEKNGVRLFIIPGLHTIFPARPHVEMLGDIPLVTIRDIPLDELRNSILKRLFDILFSIFAIVGTFPLMAIIAVIIKLTSRGPLIFKQERIGKNRRPFMMYKFRSMKQQTSEASNTEWTTKDDPRKTKFGAFLRKTSLDELPQFFNVLKGDMSIVGPRPERPYFVEQFKEQIPKYMVKHHVRPGITGWAQVNGLRGDTSISKRIIYDIFYIENWTFVFDLKIIIKTFINGLISKNAY